MLLLLDIFESFSCFFYYNFYCSVCKYFTMAKCVYFVHKILFFFSLSLSFVDGTITVCLHYILKERLLVACDFCCFFLLVSLCVCIFLNIPNTGLSSFWRKNIVSFVILFSFLLKWIKNSMYILFCNLLTQYFGFFSAFSKIFCKNRLVLKCQKWNKRFQWITEFCCLFVWMIPCQGNYFQKSRLCFILSFTMLCFVLFFNLTVNGRTSKDVKI